MNWINEKVHSRFSTGMLVVASFLLGSGKDILVWIPLGVLFISHVLTAKESIKE